MIFALVLIPRLRPAVAIDMGSISVRTRKGWKTLDLRELKDVGGTRSISAIGVFGSPRIRTSLVFVDTVGHRLNLETFSVSEPVFERIKENLGSAIATPFAASVLGIDGAE